MKNKFSASCVGNCQLLPAFGSLEKANPFLLGTAGCAEQVAAFTKCLQVERHCGCHLMPGALRGFP